MNTVVIGTGNLGQAMIHLLRSGGRAREIAAWDKPWSPIAATALKEADVVFVCTKAEGVDIVLNRLAKKTTATVVLMSKGLVPDGNLVTVRARDFLPEKSIAFMGGPMFADDIMHGRPCAATVAGQDAGAVREIAGLFESTNLVVSISDNADMMAAGGVFKNIYALAAGFVVTLFGDSARGMMLAEARSEMSSIMRRSSLSGFDEGDATPFLTATADLDASACQHSRNFALGAAIANGLVGPKDMDVQEAEAASSLMTAPPFDEPGMSRYPILVAARAIVREGVAARSHFEKLWQNDSTECQH